MYSFLSLFSLWFFLFINCIVVCCDAQQKDFQTWNSIGLEKSLTKKLDFSLSEELRLRDNSTRLRTAFTDIGVKYELLKNFDIGIYYRFILQTEASAHRQYIDVSYKHNLQRWSLQGRIRYQHQVERETAAKNYFRPKLTLDYKINKKLKPFISGEAFYHAVYYKGDEIDEFRLSLGIGYNFNKRNSIKGFYLLEQEVNVNNAEQDHVAGLSYEYDF